MQEESARFFYSVGKRDVKDKWLKNTRIQDYHIFLLKSFELLEGQSCLAFLKEKDKDNILKIDQIQREIEDIADLDIYNRSELETAGIKAKLDKIVADTLHDTQDILPFQKTSKILGKTLLREAFIELKQIRVISDSKQKLILHTEFEFQIEKIELPLGSNLKKSSVAVAVKNINIKVEKEFNPPKGSSVRPAVLHPSNLKWIDTQLAYRMVLRNNTNIQNRNTSNKFEYAIYFKSNFELIKVRDMIKSGVVLLRIEQIKQQFKKLASKWKSEVARGIYQNLDRYPERLTDRVLSSASQKGQYSSSSQQGIGNNRNSYGLNSSMSQDFTSNRASAKPFMFRNNLSLAENQLHFLGELEELKEKESQTNEENQDERDQVIEQILKNKGNNKGRHSIDSKDNSNQNLGNSFDEVESVDLNKVIQKTQEQFDNYEPNKVLASQTIETYESMPSLLKSIPSINTQQNTQTIQNATEEIDHQNTIQLTQETKSQTATNTGQQNIPNQSENPQSHGTKRTKRSLMFGKPQIEQEVIVGQPHGFHNEMQMPVIQEQQESPQQNNESLTLPPGVLPSRLDSKNNITKTQSQSLNNTKPNDSMESIRQTAKFIDSQNQSYVNDQRSHSQGIPSLTLISYAGQRQEMSQTYQSTNSKHFGMVQNQSPQDIEKLQKNNTTNDPNTLNRTINNRLNVPLLQLPVTVSSHLKQNQITDQYSSQQISSDYSLSSERIVTNEYKQFQTTQQSAGNNSTGSSQQQYNSVEQINFQQIRFEKGISNENQQIGGYMSNPATKNGAIQQLDPLSEEEDLGTCSVKSEDATQLNDKRGLKTNNRTNFKVEKQNGSFSFLNSAPRQERQQQLQQNDQLIQVKEQFKQIKTSYLNQKTFKTPTATYLSPYYQKIPEAKSALIVGDHKLPQEEEQSITMMDYLRSTAKAERTSQKQTDSNQEFIKLSEQQKQQIGKTEKGSQNINKGQERGDYHQQVVQEFTASEEEVSFYLQKVELICPTRDIAPQIIVQIQLSLMNEEEFDKQQISFQTFHHSNSNHNINKANINGEKSSVVHKWEDFIEPVKKIEDNYVYTVQDDDCKRAVFSVSTIELYVVDVEIQNNPGGRVLGKIRVNLQDLLDLNEPGKDFWLLCPISLHSIPFALVNLWTSLKSQCADFQEYNKRFYQQLQVVFHPHYNTSVHFPELKTEELDRIAVILQNMGYNDKWLASRESIEREQSFQHSKSGLKTENIKKYISVSDDQHLSDMQISPLVTGEKYTEIKRALQYGFSNRMGFAQANLFIQENIYNSLFTKLQEGSLPQQEIARHFHQLCLEGIPYSQRQEIYLELLNTQDKLSNLRDNFVSYAVTNPAQKQNLPYEHATSDIYLSTELNAQINEVHALLRDPNLMENRQQFYNILWLEAQFYELTFEIDQHFPFADDANIAVRVLTVLSFAMQISYETVRLQFHSQYNHLLDKCLILNRKLPQDAQESEAFWLLFSIISKFNIDIAGFAKYFHLFESSTNFNSLSNLVEVDGLLGLFSGSFHEELCFRCWDMVFMEEKRKTWDVLGYLTCIGIALCNKYAIATKTEWEVLGKYYTNFTEFNRIAKETYESLLGNERNCTRWNEKQLMAEQLRSSSVERNHHMKQIIAQVIQDTGLEFQMDGIEKLVEDMLRNSFYAEKYYKNYQLRKLMQSQDSASSKILVETPIKQMNTPQKDKQQIISANTADFQTLGSNIDNFEGPALPSFNGTTVEKQQDNSLDRSLGKIVSPPLRRLQNTLAYKSENFYQINNQFIQDKTNQSTYTAFSQLSPGIVDNNLMMDADKENLFMRENLHFYVISLSETDTEQQQHQPQISTSPTKTSKIRFNAYQQSQRRLQIGGRDILIENEQVIEKYQFFEGVEHTPFLPVQMKTTLGDEYSGTIDLRSFDRDTMYQSMIFLVSSDSPSEITCQFTLYVESSSLKQIENSPEKRKIFQLQQSYLSPSRSLKIPQLLHNDVCVNSSSTNEPLERHEAFEKCYNNQNLLECNVRHFVYGRNILTQDYRKFYTETGNYRLLVQNIVRPEQKAIFRDLLNELTGYRDSKEEEDLIGLLQIILLYTASSFERKSLLLFKLFQLRFPYQTSSDLESFIIDFSMKLEISFLSIRDIQELLHLHEKNNFGITQATLLMEGSSAAINVTELFTKISRKICRTYLLMSFDLNQSFLIEEMLASMENKNQDVQQNSDGDRMSPNNQYFPQYDLKTRKGNLTVWYKIHSKVISQSVDYNVDSTGRVLILQSQEQAIPPKALFSRHQQAIKNKALCLQLAQCSGWINLAPIAFIENEISFKQYVSNLHFLEQFMMKTSTATVQRQLFLKHPILLQVNYMETTQIFCDSVFSQSLVYKFHAQTNTINYLESLNLDSSMITVLPRILGKSISFIKRHMQVLINKKLVEDLSLPLKRIINIQDLDKSAGIINATLIDKSQQTSQEEDDQETLDSQGMRNYTFNGYSLWKICSSYQYLPCKLSQDNSSFKRDVLSPEYHASSQQEIFRWY